MIVMDKPKRIRLVSNTLCYGPMPAPDKEIEQHLTINSKGQVWFSSYNFGVCGKPYKKSNFQKFSINKEKAEILLNTISKYFYDEYQDLFVTDIGFWKLEITDINDQIYEFNGSLCGNFQLGKTDLSELLRSTLCIDNLFAFNGQKINSKQCPQ